MVSLNGRVEIRTRIVKMKLDYLGWSRQQIWRPTLTAALFVAPPGLLYARSSGPDFQHDPVEYWAARILAWVLSLAVILVAYALVKAVRGRLVGISGKALMLIGVVILPSFSIATGMLLVFTRAERVEFCASCHHVMQAYADDLTDPDGTGLAAIHFVNRYIPTNQCYECHTSYGLFGTAEAKMHGIGEVLKYYTGAYEVPLSMWKPYPNADCLKCHAESSLWLSVDAHTYEETEEELFANAISCMECHGSAHGVRIPTKMAGL
jgi:nitrate/TMAO reductase-like tetraheme cytochrome c subunit